MNRIEIVGLFTALKRLLDGNDYDGVREVVEDVLKEAKRPEPPEKKYSEV